MTDRNDQLVEGWLGALGRATADLPQERRVELLTDLREHIAAARADLAPETEAGVRTILDRLGDPASIAAEARFGAAPAWPAQAPMPTRRTHTPVVVVIVTLAVTLVLLCAGLLVAGVAVYRPGDGGGPVPTPTENPSHRS